jgi:class 3 adenylate cyclase
MSQRRGSAWEELAIVVAVVPSGTVTFLFTDIEGSTEWWDQQPVAMRPALERHDEILRGAVMGHGGFVFASGGDGIDAAFQRSVDAVEAAVEAQRALQSEAWPAPIVLKARMGIHTGEAQERGGNYFGAPLNRAARLMGAAHGGQILVSRATAEVLDPVAGIDLVDLGLHRLRGLVASMQIFALRSADLMWVDRPLAANRDMTGNLPRLATEFVGRVAELGQLAESLRRRRLLTLTGPGGVGKTRLAVESGWSVVDEFPGGVWLVDLAAVGDSEAVVAAVASLLAIQPQRGMSMVESIVDWLRSQRLLLIVDNCEHVLASVVPLIDAVVSGCPNVVVLATSREPFPVCQADVRHLRWLTIRAGRVWKT